MSPEKGKLWAISTSHDLLNGDDMIYVQVDFHYPIRGWPFWFLGYRKYVTTDLQKNSAVTNVEPSQIGIPLKVRINNFPILHLNMEQQGLN